MRGIIDGMSTQDKVYARHPISGVVGLVRPFEAQLFGMEVLETNKRTGKPVINKPKEKPEAASPKTEDVKK